MPVEGNAVTECILQEHPETLPELENTVVMYLFPGTLAGLSQPHIEHHVLRSGPPAGLMAGPMDERFNFDTAIATFVFCSVPDPVLGLKELRRVVKSGGEILLLEHVRIDKPVIGFIMDIMNPIVLYLIGANINRTTVENVEKAGLCIEKI
jgi:hypothetical protein